MKPYYEHNGMVIYHGDCRDVLPAVSADVLVTDPPWLASTAQFDLHGASKIKSHSRHRTLRYGTLGLFDPGLVKAAADRVASDCLVVVGYKELGAVASLFDPLRGVFVWHKPNAALPVSYPAKMDTSFIVWGGKHSLLYGRQIWPSSVFSVSLPTAGCINNGERVTQGSNGPAAHPAQAPVALFTTLLTPFAGKVVLDPFMGTGTTLRAAKNLGCLAIGIEIEERYCEIAARRLAQDVLLTA